MINQARRRDLVLLTQHVNRSLPWSKLCNIVSPHTLLLSLSLSFSRSPIFITVFIPETKLLSRRRGKRLSAWGSALNSPERSFPILPSILFRPLLLCVEESALSSRFSLNQKFQLLCGCNFKSLHACSKFSNLSTDLKESIGSCVTWQTCALCLGRRDDQRRRGRGGTFAPSIGSHAKPESALTESVYVSALLAQRPAEHGARFRRWPGQAPR